MKKGSAIVFVVFSLGILPVSVSAQSCGLCAKEVVVDSTSAPCLAKELAQIDEGSAPFLQIDLSQCVESDTKNRGVVPPLPKPLDSPQTTARFILDAQNAECLRKELVRLKGKLDPFAIIKLSKCS